MPNHVQNRIEIIGSNEEINKVLNAIKGDEPFDDGAIRKIDFNKIIPMPKTLEITYGSLGEMAHHLLFGYNKRGYELFTIQKRFSELSLEDQKEAVELALEYNQNLQKYGHTTWYDWAIANWGTKWNAYAQ